MTDPRRPWFQFHLSTALVLMFAASGLLWLNLNSDVARKTRKADGSIAVDWRGPGWPIHSGMGMATCSTQEAADEFVSRCRSHKPEFGTFVGMLVVDGPICLVILFAIGFLCEWRIRRKGRT